MFRWLAMIRALEAAACVGPDPMVDLMATDGGAGRHPDGAGGPGEGFRGRSLETGKWRC